ncbi:MAG TPA: DUF3035 domain-containing protein [Micropepsaceae bacterium]|nr:DUF3035 domain-containing protein [Micropepsaceae bacterium]
MRHLRVLRSLQLVVFLAPVAALGGCSGFNEAIGATKNPPDEFTVLTKSPLIIPPDYNLRPPQPGVASRNEPDPDDQARVALFPQDAATQAAALGTAYSDGEKLLLTKTNALSVDPNIRKQVNADVGQDDQGPAFTQKVLYQATGAAPAMGAMPMTPAALAAPARPQTPPQNLPLPGTGQPPPSPTPRQ